MANDADLEARLEDIEVKYAFQQETIETLNSTVTDQWTEIDRLRRSLAQLQGQIADLEDAQGPTDPGNIKPPHY